MIYAKTRREVREKLAAALRTHQQGLPLPGERLTVGGFLERWLVEAVRAKVRPRTFESYAGIVRRHLVPGLGRVPLAKLTPQDVQAFLNRQQAAGLSARTVHYQRAVLRAGLNRALRWGLVARNVAALVDSPRVTCPEVRPLTSEQARVFLDAVRGDRLEALYTVALGLGLRQGEALGLCWDDVDLEGRLGFEPRTF